MLGRGGRLVAFAWLLFVGAVLSSQCSKPAPPAQSSAPPALPPSPQFAASPLLGDMKPVVSVKELMKDMIDPMADNIFDAVWWEATPKAVLEHRPKSDDDWEKVEIGAVTIAEGIYLLKVPRPFTPFGDVNNSLGPNPPELSPTQIKAKLDNDPVLWIAKIEALRNVALETLEAVKQKDVSALFEAGGHLDVACEECHLEYWYPRDRDTVLRERKARATVEGPKAPSSVTGGRQ
jgi:hypothetical protein